MRKSAKRQLFRYWGYIALLLVVAGWITKDVGPTILLFASLLCTFYFLFQAPMWCGAVTRDDKYCRNNSYGILVGCHNRQHKWQSVMMMTSLAGWGEVCGRTLRTIGGQAAGLSTIATLVSALAAVITLLFK